MTKTPGPDSAADDADILAAIDDAVAAGDTCVNGEPSTADVAAHLDADVEQETVSEWLLDLEQRGQVESHVTTKLGEHGRCKTVVRADDEDDGVDWSRYSLRGGGSA